ncbi:MAG TPA: ArgE/DapE family deacylase [Opitutaceae bacterium]
MTPAAYLDANTPALLALLQKLVRIDTVNPPGENYAAITTLLARELGRAGLRTRRLPVPRADLERHLPPEQLAYPRFNVIGTRRGGREATRTIHFNAHYDVVPVSGAWRNGGPFSGTVEGNWIYGRGTADMKGSIASLILALRALHETGTDPKLHIEVSFTADEETDSLLGAGWIVKHAPIKPDYAVVMEGGERDAICCGHNGVVWLNVIVHGRAAHGSQPHHGVNALEKMSALVLALEDYKRRLATRTFASPGGVTMTPTVNLGGVFTAGPGGKVNTVPSQASFSIDRRVLATETVTEAERELRSVLAESARAIPQCRITIEKISDNHPCFSPPEHPFFGAMARCVQRIRRSPTVFNVSTGFNDMHFFVEHLRIPTLGYGPGGERFHAVDERASVRELVRSAKIYAELLTTFAG